MTDATFWTVTVILGIGTFLIRFSFLGLFGGRQLPDWALTHLRYVAVAIMPAMVTPLVLWPAATEGQTDPARLLAAVAGLLAGLRFGVVPAIVAGMGTLWVVQAILP